MENTVKLQQPLPQSDFAGKTPEEIIAARREIAANHMRAMGAFFWRAEEDVVYTLLNDILRSQAGHPGGTAVSGRALFLCRQHRCGVSGLCR